VLVGVAQGLDRLGVVDRTPSRHPVASRRRRSRLLASRCGRRSCTARSLPRRSGLG
jgi:hypothetical protein